MFKKLIKNGIYPIIKSQPDFLIIGAQKAGTTALYRYLSQHPQILENNTWKEIHYFDKSENYAQGFGWYLGHFPSKFQKRRKLTCDATPSYIYFQHVPKVIKQDLGNIKMIAVLRDPVARAYSSWQMHHSFVNNSNQKHNVGKYKFTKTSDDEAKIELLKSYFAPFNEKLYTLLGSRYNW